MPCRKLSSFANGYIRETVQNSLQFECKTEYKLYGQSNITCSKGKFNHPIPVCKG